MQSIWPISKHIGVTINRVGIIGRKSCWCAVERSYRDDYVGQLLTSSRSWCLNCHQLSNDCNQRNNKIFAARWQRSFTSQIVEKFPSSIQSYLKLVRLDRPVGTYLLYIPCSWSTAMAGQAGHLPDMKLLTIFAIGSLVMRGAGCTINDMWDFDYDKKVFRTRDRPIATGVITHKKALVFLATQMSIGLALLLQLNLHCIILGVCSIPFIIIYPLMKRFTHWPQLFLGITFNWGAMVGFAAVQGYCDWNVVLPLYAACISWTLFYDTIYAHQDKDDDRMINVKSTALLFGDATKYWLCLFAAVTTANLALSGYCHSQTWPFYAGICGGFAHMIYQLYDVNLSKPSDCLAKFTSNKWFGVIIFAGIVAGTLLKTAEKEENKE